MSQPDHPTAEPSPEELAAELDELRDEVEKLKGPRRSRFRGFVVGLLIVLATVLAVGTNQFAWLERTLLDTETYIDTIEPLPQDEAVSEALATVLVKQLFEETDLETTIEDALPDDAAFLASPLSNAIESFATNAAQELIQSDQFTDVWVTINGTTHALAVKVLEGGGDVVGVEDGQVTLDLSQAVQDLATELGASDQLGSLVGNLDLPEDAGTVVLFEDDQLGITQLLVEWLHRLSWFLPGLMIACYAGAVALSHNRRRAVIGVGVSLIVAMLVTRIMLDITLETLLELPERELGREALEAFWDIMIRGLEAQSQMIFALGVVLLAGGLVTGPYRWAVSLRRLAGGLLGSAGERVEEQPGWVRTLAGTVGPRRNAFFAGGVIGALVILWMWSVPTVRVVLSLTILLLVYLAGVQLLSVLSAQSPDEGVEAA